MEPRIIALYSHAPQSGKTTVARHLAYRHGYTPIKFAEPIKAMVSTLLDYTSLSYDRIFEAIEGRDKERRIGELGGTTARRMLQTLGVEWGRKCIDENIWANLLVERVAHDNIKYVIDDLRFPNEMAALRKLVGVKFWRVDRSDIELNHGHASDGLLDGMQFDTRIQNDGSLEQLHKQIDEALA
jgi:hypothetical protein